MPRVHLRLIRRLIEIAVKLTTCLSAAGCSLVLIAGVSRSALAQDPLPLVDPPGVHWPSHGSVTTSLQPPQVAPLSPPHFVIESPQIRAAQDPEARTLHKPKPAHPVAIADAQRVSVWKQPYSYGHFGASHTRHWSLHHGHQRSYTQWTLR